MDADPQEAPREWIEALEGHRTEGPGPRHFRDRRRWSARRGEGINPPWFRHETSMTNTIPSLTVLQPKIPWRRAVMEIRSRSILHPAGMPWRWSSAPARTPTSAVTSPSSRPRQRRCTTPGFSLWKSIAHPRPDGGWPIFPGPLGARVRSRALPHRPASPRSRWTASAGNRQQAFRPSAPVG